MAKQSKESKEVTSPSRPWLMEPWRDMEHMFEGFFDRRWPGLHSLLPRQGVLSPSIDVKEDDKSITVNAELPGLDEADVEVTLRNGVLTIKGEKKMEAEKKEDNFHVTERRFGSFQRSFSVPESVDEDAVEAAFDKGVLSIQMPKRQDAARAAKKIKIGKKTA